MCQLVPYNETLITKKFQVEVTIVIKAEERRVESKFIIKSSQVCEVRYLKKY